MIHYEDWLISGICVCIPGKQCKVLLLSMSIIWMQLVRLTGSEETIFSCREVQSDKLLVKEWLVQLFVMNESEFHENLGECWLISELIVEVLSLLVFMYPFGMLLVDRIYESVFSNS